MVELKHNPPHILWADMPAAHMIVPSFLDGPVNTVRYAEMFEVWLISRLTEIGLMEDV
jgi:hypothetical protein